MVRVRFAPSPTGPLHIGGVRTALFNWLFARHHQGKFILRIEDTDVSRSRKEMVEGIIEGLRWLGLDWDEGPEVGGPYAPYFQSQRLSIYQKYAQKLVEEEKAYFCFCTPEELEERRKIFLSRGEVPVYDGRCRNLSPKEIEKFIAEGRKKVIRFKWEKPVTSFQDLIHGKIDFGQHHFDDFVIMKADGTPTYNFACVIDDHLMEITHVIRGDDHITNTPRQLAIYFSFGWSPPEFAHIPLILGPDRSKLSKRHGATELLEYRKKGYLPEALINFLALLGWSPDTNQEILGREELINSFSLKQVTKRNAIFNLNKLNWLNGEYIRRIPLKEFIPRVKETIISTFPDSKRFPPQWWEKFSSLYQSRIKNLSQLVEDSSFFFLKDYPFDKESVEEFLKKPYVPSMLKKIQQEIQKIANFKAPLIEECLRKLAEKLGLSGKEFIHPLRVALTGKKVSPPLFEVMELLGKERCLKRIERALNLLEGKE